MRLIRCFSFGKVSNSRVGNDPELTAKIYDICDPLSDTDARSIRERIREQ